MVSNSKPTYSRGGQIVEKSVDEPWQKTRSSVVKINESRKNIHCESARTREASGSSIFMDFFPL